MNVERKNAKDDLRLYMPEVIEMLKREGQVPGNACLCLHAAFL